MKTLLHFFLFPCFTLNLLLTPMAVDEARRVDAPSLSATTERLTQIVESFVACDEIVGVRTVRDPQSPAHCVPQGTVTQEVRSPGK